MDPSWVLNLHNQLMLPALNLSISQFPPLWILFGSFPSLTSSAIPRYTAHGIDKGISDVPNWFPTPKFPDILGASWGLLKTCNMEKKKRILRCSTCNMGSGCCSVMHSWYDIAPSTYDSKPYLHCTRQLIG